MFGYVLKKVDFYLRAFSVFFLLFANFDIAPDNFFIPFVRAILVCLIFSAFFKLIELFETILVAPGLILTVIPLFVVYTGFTNFTFLRPGIICCIVGSSRLNVKFCLIL